VASGAKEWPKLRKIRVLLADDHPGLLATARSLLNPEVDVVGCVDNGESLFEASVRLRPDVIRHFDAEPQWDTGCESAEGSWVRLQSPILDSPY
jgi:chemotaxis response regulator CheB